MGIGSSGTPRPGGCWPRCCTPPPSAAGTCATCWAGWPTRNGPSARSPVLLRRAADPAFEQDATAVRADQRTDPHLDHLDDHARARLAHPPGRGGRGRAHRLRLVERGVGAGFRRGPAPQLRATVFLLGAEETQAAPLVCALTGHIAREARRLAALQPGGRLDPNLTLVLDEAALVSPVPLDSWTADMGGRGVTILAAFQSRAQVLARWGEHAAATILNNTSAVMVFGGTRDRDDLQFWSTLTGDRDERITSHDLHGRGRDPDGAEGAGAGAGADREPARGEGPGHPPRPRPRGRAGPARVAAPRRPHPPARLRPGRRGGRARRPSGGDRSGAGAGASSDGEWEIPADWFADTAMPAPDDGDDRQRRRRRWNRGTQPMTTMPPQNTRRGNSRPTGIPVDARATTETARPPWLIDRDLDAVAAYLDPWILGAEPNHDSPTTAVPLLGTPEWVAADDTTRDASVALYVLACLAEREPVVIAARLAAEIAAGRTAHLVAIAAGLARHEQRPSSNPATAGGVPDERPHRRPDGGGIDRDGAGWSR